MRRGQELEVGTMYLVFFILLVTVGGYWIVRSNTWVEYDMLYGKPSQLTGRITRVDPCEDPKRMVVMMESGKTQAYTYLGFRTDATVGDEVTVTAYNVSGKGLLFDIFRSKCEPSGFHYYATRLYNPRTGFDMKALPQG